jgi:hypothetical protein
VGYLCCKIQADSLYLASCIFRFGSSTRRGEFYAPRAVGHRRLHCRRGPGPLLAGVRFRVFHLGCVFILGGVVPSFAVGDKAWGEFVSGGSPDPALQRLTVEIFDAQLRHGFTIQAVWRPRELNVRADYLSRVSAMLPASTTTASCLAYSAGWTSAGGLTPSTASPASTRASPWRLPTRGVSARSFFHPAAAWVDAFSLPWSGETKWIFPPVPYIAQTVAHLRASRAVGTLVAPFATWAPGSLAYAAGATGPPGSRGCCASDLRACACTFPPALTHFFAVAS